MRRAIDGSTAAQVRARLEICTRRGSDPVRALDELGLLLHPGLRRQIMADTLLQTADLLSHMTCRQLIVPGRLMPTTPLDTKDLVEVWLRAQAAEISERIDGG